MSFLFDSQWYAKQKTLKRLPFSLFHFLIFSFQRSAFHSLILSFFHSSAAHSPSFFDLTWAFLGVWCLFFWHCIAIFQLSWTLFTFKLSFFICHLSFSAAHVILSLISLHGAPCIIITLCPAGKLRFTVYRNYGCWCGVLASSLPASHWYFLHFFRKTFGGFTLIYLFCNCSLAEVSLSGEIEGGNLYIKRRTWRFVLDE